MTKTIWLAMSYNVPINPSKARVYVWRKLKSLGAEALRPGVAVLPNTGLNDQEFSELAQKIRQMGGEAVIFDLRFHNPADEQALTERFRQQTQAEYRELLSDCAHTLRRLRVHSPGLSRQESEKIRRIVERYCRTRSRDYFNAGAASREIEEGLGELVEGVRGVAGEFGKQLCALLDD